MNTKTGKAICLAAALALALLCSCGDSTVKTENSDDVQYTSTDLNIYKAKTAGGEVIATDGEGNRLDKYSVDEDGNILKGGRQIISSENVSEYTYISSIISLTDSSAADVKLPRQIKAGTVDETENVPVTMEYKLYISPAKATNPSVRVRSGNTNYALLITQSGSTGSGEAVYNAEDGIASVYVRCIKPGSAEISVNADDGSGVTASFRINITEDSAPDAAVKADTELIESTEYTTGWITGQNVRLRSKPESSSDTLAYYNTGREIVILSADTDGWTKCMADGKTGYIKSEYVTRIKPAASSTTASPVTVTTVTTPVPTASASGGTPAVANDGGDHGNAYGQEREAALEEKSLAQEADNHTHHYVKYKTVAPTSTSKGCTVYRCECGKSFKTNWKEALSNENETGN